MDNNYLTVDHKKCATLIEHALSTDTPVMLHSSPGMGKSDLFKQAAEAANLKLIDHRLTTSDPTDLSGLISMDQERKRATYTPLDLFPLEDAQIPKGYDGWLLLFDELPSAPLAVQSASYRVILDREVGQHKLHPAVRVMAAGNLKTDKAIVNKLGTAMQSRLTHLVLQVNTQAWLERAEDDGIDSRLLSFIRFKNDMLHKFDPNHNDLTFACPRTWYKVSNLIKGVPNKNLQEIRPLITGTVGKGAGIEFVSYTSVFEDIPTIEEIMRDPENAALPDKASTRYAVTGMLTAAINEDTIETLMVYIARLSKEFQVVCLMPATRKNPELVSLPCLTDWISKNYQLFSS